MTSLKRSVSSQAVLLTCPPVIDRRDRTWDRMVSSRHVGKTVRSTGKL